MALGLAQAGSTPIATDVNDTSGLPKTGAGKITPPGGFGAGYGAPSAGILSQVQAGGGTSTSSAAGGGSLGLAPAATAAPGANLTAAGTTATAPLPTEYPSAPSTTGAPQNRLQLATSAFDTFAKSTAPQYTADLREATQKAAGAGALGSGQLRTTYGNLANQRALALDTERSNLINSATTGTIADQQAAQGLGIQQENADTSKAGTLGGLGIQQQNADTAKTSALGNLDVAKGQLALATAAQDISSKVQLGQLSIAQASAALDEKVKTGELTIDQARQALDQINSDAANKVSQQNANTAQAGQQATAENQAGQLQLAKDQLAQAGTQFGLSLAQQKDLATLADKTQNRQIDVSSAQGQASLALELARIMGAKDLNSIDPTFLQAIAKALGYATGGPPPPPPPPPGKTGVGTGGVDPGTGGTDGGTGDTRVTGG